MANQTQNASADRGHRSVRGSWRAGRHRRNGNRSLPEAQAKEEPAGCMRGPNLSARGNAPAEPLAGEAGEEPNVGCSQQGGQAREETRLEAGKKNFWR